jgi:hypothetical protein
VSSSTSRRAELASKPVSGLPTSSRAPAAIASSPRRASRPTSPDSTTIGVGRLAMIARIASRPPTNGRTTSIEITSGQSAAARAIA